MATQPLRQSASAQASAAGAVTLAFGTVPVGAVWSGTFSVPTSDAGAVWTAHLGSATGAVLQSWVGKTVAGPLSLQAGEALVITGTGLTANSAQQAVFLGRSDDNLTAPFFFPDPLVSSLSLSQLIAGILKTASPPNRRIEISTDEANTISFYTGDSAETAPGKVQVDQPLPDIGILRFLSPNLGQGVSTIVLQSDDEAGAGGSSVTLFGDAVRVLASLLYFDDTVNAGVLPALIGERTAGPNTTTDQYFVQIGNEAVNTNPAGDVTVNFPTAFPGGVAAVVCTSTDDAQLAIQSQGAASFVTRHRTAAGGLRASVPVSFEWMAYGW